MHRNKTATVTLEYRSSKSESWEALKLKSVAESGQLEVNMPAAVALLRVVINGWSLGHQHFLSVIVEDLHIYPAPPPRRVPPLIREVTYIHVRGAEDFPAFRANREQS